MAQYTHTTGYHNLTAPKEIVPVIMDLIHPKSVIDIGCGLGTFLRVFKENGVSQIFGIDGAWCNKELLFQNIKPDEFQVRDMEKSLGLNERFDLAICLEVAEHLSEGRADSFIKELALASDTILFSAAIPKQGGDHHYNEQWIEYWKSKFEQHGFELHDVLRPIFWENENIYFWYKQNMVLFVKKGLAPESIISLHANQIEKLVHPELFTLVSDYRDKNAIKRYLRGLIKAVSFRIGITK